MDQVLSNYRLHSESKTVAVSDRYIVANAIRVSRRYWGDLPRLERWKLLASYGRFRLHRWGRAVSLLRSGRDHWRRGSHGRALGYGALGAMNPYMIPASTIGQMVRSGTMDRGMLTAAAGFAGPESAQLMGAATQQMQQSMAFQNTGLGRGIMAGLLSGGGGGTNLAVPGRAPPIQFWERRNSPGSLSAPRPRARSRPHPRGRRSVQECVVR